MVKEIEDWAELFSVSRKEKLFTLYKHTPWKKSYNLLKIGKDCIIVAKLSELMTGKKRHCLFQWVVITTYCTDLDVDLQDTEEEENQNCLSWVLRLTPLLHALTPPEGDGPGPVSPLLDQRLVELSPRATVNRGPALLTIILKQYRVLKVWFYPELYYLLHAPGDKSR